MLVLKLNLMLQLLFQTLLNLLRKVLLVHLLLQERHLLSKMLLHGLLQLLRGHHGQLLQQAGLRLGLLTLVWLGS